MAHANLFVQRDDVVQVFGAMLKHEWTLLSGSQLVLGWLKLTLLIQNGLLTLIQ